MGINEKMLQDDGTPCHSCTVRGEKLQAIGASIYFVSLFSCGVLLPFSLIAAIVIQALASMKCKECRAEAKKILKNPNKSLLLSKTSSEGDH